MKLAIDARPLLWARSGIGRNLRQTLRHLIRSRPTWEMSLLFNRAEDAARAEKLDDLRGGNVRVHCLPSPVPIYSFLALPTWLGIHRPDVFVSSIPEAFPIRIRPTAVYVYDLIPERFPKLMPLRHRVLAAVGLYRAVNRMADAVFTLSENTKRELVEYHHIDSRKIHVVPGMLDESFTVIDRDQAREEVSRLLGGNYRVVLSMNTVRMAEFFRSCSEYLERADTDVRVVLVGKPPAWEKFRRLLPEEDRERFIGLDHVTDHELLCLYNHATCFVFPSYYEGFGYPPVEAMACGTPVIVYSGSSLDEVGGEAALRVTPGGVSELASAISSMMNDRAARERLVTAGLARASFYRGQNLIHLVTGPLEEMRSRGIQRPHGITEAA